MDFQLTTEQRMLVSTARDIAKRSLAPKAKRWDTEAIFPRENLAVLAEAGLLGLTLPAEYGGGGATMLDLVLVMEEIAKACPASAFIVSSQSGIGARAIALHGSEELKSTLLPRLCNGEILVAWAMSEPDGGSDLGAARTNAVSLPGGGYRLSGEKTWISFATVADHFLVITRFDGEPGLPGLGAVLVPRETPGLHIGSKIHTLGIRGTGMASVAMADCEIPEQAVLLGRGQFRSLLEIMNGERVASNPPISLGIATAALEAAREYLLGRAAFGRTLADFQGLRWKIADMTVKLDAARMLVYRAAANAGAGLPSILEASVAKVAANEAAVAIADEALQLHGAAGYALEMPIERYVRDARGMCIGDGTVEIQRNMIANSVLGRVR